MVKAWPPTFVVRARNLTAEPRPFAEENGSFARVLTDDDAKAASVKVLLAIQ